MGSILNGKIYKISNTHTACVQHVDHTHMSINILYLGDPKQRLYGIILIHLNSSIGTKVYNII